MATASARAEARFKQLCCLGLGGEAVMPALFRELRMIVPSCGLTFFFVDERGVLRNIYDENPETSRLALLYMEDFYDRRERAGGYSFSDSLRQLAVHGLEELSSVDPAAYRRSEHYNCIYRPLGYEDFIRLIVRDSGRTFGAVTPHRSPGERRFAPEDRRRLAALGPFFAHAFTDNRASSAALVETGAIGLIIADSAGRPVYLSREGRRLLFLATHPHTNPGAAVRRAGSLPPALVQLCRNLGRLFLDDPSASAPVHHHRNAWGGFSFRAYWLEDADRGASLIGITVSHQEPLPVKLTHNLQHLALSRRQSEVCLLLAMGSSYDQIAKKLGISKHTAIAHSRWIYNKLDVHNRAELINRLLCAQS
jgi:DNA-binding CsgD family transcriptional regulator